ncbi:6baee7b6-4c66-4409-8c0b-ece9661d1065 [Sclerotinia trifoliorum]|uniref:6baee7b6-4c66-4409-8c0b-ece9661d1065 n=1 Tax=Sclerotinia trifoliorum TaxID=28548 RepID=A0A8H2ZN91_9HELO|nr:6baee7b6-4c66-4409-8c0b-ece9661d1065 [Sclerotinia trifoliorum]
MPDVPLHKALGVGLSWLGGGKGKALKNLKKAHLEIDLVESSMELHHMAQAMGLESVSKDENINNNTHKSRRHHEKSKNEPPPKTSIPMGPSRSGSTIDYSKTDGYQRSIWQRDGGYSSYSDKLPAHDSPLITIGYTENSSEYPGAELGMGGKPWGRQSPPAHSTLENYVLPYRTSGTSQVGSPVGSKRFPAELPTSANKPSEEETHVIGSGYKSNSHQHQNYQGHLQSSLPSSPQAIFDPVRDAAARNRTDSAVHTNPKSDTSSHAILTRKPVQSFPYQQAPIGEKIENSKSYHKEERAKINRRNEEEVLQERRERKLKDIPQESKKPHDVYIDEACAAKIRHRNEEEILRERKERKLKESRKINQQADTQLPPSLPPKIPLSFNIRPDHPPPNTAISQGSIRIPISSSVPTSSFIPHNSYLITPANQHMHPNKPTTQNNINIQNHTIHDHHTTKHKAPQAQAHSWNKSNAFLTRAPPTFPIYYPAARELDGTSIYVEINHDHHSPREHIRLLETLMNIEGIRKKDGERIAVDIGVDMDVDVDVRSSSMVRARRYAFAEKTNLVLGTLGTLGSGYEFVREKGAERAGYGGGRIGAGGMYLYGENVYPNGMIRKDLVGAANGERRVPGRGEQNIPEIQVRSPTLSAALRAQKDAGIHMNTDRNFTRMNEETEELPVPELGIETEHMHIHAKESGRRRHRHAHKHRHHSHKRDIDGEVDAARSI